MSFMLTKPELATWYQIGCLTMCRAEVAKATAQAPYRMGLGTVDTACTVACIVPLLSFDENEARLEVKGT